MCVRLHRPDRHIKIYGKARRHQGARPSLPKRTDAKDAVLARRQGPVLRYTSGHEAGSSKRARATRPAFRLYSVLTAMLNVLPLTVRSCNVAALRRLPVSAPLAAGSVIVAIAPISARSPNGPGAKRL